MRGDYPLTPFTERLARNILLPGEYLYIYSPFSPFFQFLQACQPGPKKMTMYNIDDKTKVCASSK
jgi:hypothetical protein